MISEKEFLAFCNKVRKAGEGDVLNALLPGIPSKANACLVANNLNFQCSVEPNPGTMTIRNDDHSHKEIAEKIANEVDGMEIREEDCNADKSTLKLPREIAAVAAQFDDVNDTLAKLRDEVSYAFSTECQEDINYAENALDNFMASLKASEKYWLLQLSEDY